MPIGVDSAKPVRVYDATGEFVGTETNQAAPVKTVDRVGRAIAAVEAAEVAQRAAEQAGVPASSTPAEQGDQRSADPGVGSQGPESTKQPSPAEIRQTYLEAQRARRAAQAAEKKAKDSLARAEAFEKVRSLAESGEDPTALIKAAGLDPVRFYQEMTKYALSDKGKAEADPQAKLNAEHARQLKELAERNERLEKEIQAKKDWEAHSAARQQFVDPVIRGNQDKYEVLIAQYGGVDQAVQAVYETMYELHRDTGVLHSAEDLAGAMDAHWQERAGQGIELMRKLKRFADKFAQNESATSRETVAPSREPRRSVTLSNKPSAPAAPPSLPVRTRAMTKEERVAEILKRFPDIP